MLEHDFGTDSPEDVAYTVERSSSLLPEKKIASVVIVGSERETKNLMGSDTAVKRMQRISERLFLPDRLVSYFLGRSENIPVV